MNYRRIIVVVCFCVLYMANLSLVHASTKEYFENLYDLIPKNAESQKFPGCNNLLKKIGGLIENEQYESALKLLNTEISNDIKSYELFFNRADQRHL